MKLKKKVLETVLGFVPNGDNSAETQPELSETESIQSSSDAEPPIVKKPSFIPKKKKTCNEELEAYFKEDIVLDVDPLMFWNSSLKEYPCLARLAQHVLAVPATSGAVERTFSQAGKILRPDQSRLLSKNLDTLLFLKTNSQLL